MKESIQEFHCKVYQDYKISIPVKIRKLLSISPQDEIVFKINAKNEIMLATVQLELSALQSEIKKFFSGKSIASDFLNTRKDDYDDN
jgi:bifunctional DNA-binding transcriptional regulator/antitoxin component of YhaV-PrlF toxin-antitoxin module